MKFEYNETDCWYKFTEEEAIMVHRLIGLLSVKNMTDLGLQEETAIKLRKLYNAF